MLEGTAVLWEEFLSTPSARRATCNAWSHGVAIGISIHALREEGDDGTCGRGLFGFDFYPRPPRGGRRVTTHKMRFSTTISIHALREEGDLHPLFLDAIISDISIHALREEGDTGFGRLCCCGFPISIHALREEGDGQRGWSKTTPKYFYPRPPRGGRRRREVALNVCKKISIHALREEGDALPFGSHLRILFISIHALREEGDTDDSDNTKNKAISIHALREEGDVSVTPYNGSMFTFLSTPSARRATRLLHVGTTFPAISIHALREEGDGSGAMRGGIRLYFYPRPPRGGRPSDGQASTRTLQFLSTPSARRATC